MSQRVLYCPAKWLAQGVNQTVGNLTSGSHDCLIYTPKNMKVM